MDLLTIYAHLIEIQTLRAETIRLLTLKKNEEKRVQHILKVISDKKTDLLTGLQNIQEIALKIEQHEHAITDKEKKKKKSLENQDYITTEAQSIFSQRELDLTQEQLETLELELLDLYEKKELLSKELSQYETFIEGSQESQKNIQAEVQTEVKKLDKEILQLEMRQKALWDEVPAHFSVMAKKAFVKYPEKSPLTFTEGGHCLNCQFNLGRAKENEVDSLRELHLCEMCYKILLPHNAR